MTLSCLSRLAPLLLSLLLVLGQLACRPAAPPAEEAAAEAPPPPPAQAPPSSSPNEPDAAQADDSDLPLVIFLGDSLTAGYGLDGDLAFPSVVAEGLAEEGQPIRMVNAGISGDTTAGGLYRLDMLLRQEPDVLVVSLGGNDGLRALDLSMTESNLRQIITRAREAGVLVLLTGMLVPPNYGPDYGQEFQAIFPRLAEELQVPLIPFLLEGVGGVPELNQADGIHPTAEGQRRVAELVLPHLKSLLAELES